MSNNFSTSGTETVNYGTSIWGEAFKRLLRNKAAIIGGIIFLCVVLVAVFADLAEGDNTFTVES